MKKKVGLLLFLALMLALVAVAGPAPVEAGGATVPFHADCLTAPELVSFEDPVLVLSIPGDCIGTHLGNSEWYSVLTGTLVGYPFEQYGDMVFTSANGAQLFGHYEGFFVPSATGLDGFDFWGDYWITGGTGRFEGYTGSGTYSGGPREDGGKTLTFDGTLTKP